MGNEETEETVTLSVKDVEANEQTAYHLGKADGMINIYSIMRNDRKQGFRHGMLAGCALTIGSFATGVMLKHFGIVK